MATVYGLKALLAEATPVPWVDAELLDLLEGDHPVGDNRELVIASVNCLPALVAVVEAAGEMLNAMKPLGNSTPILASLDVVDRDKSVALRMALIELAMACPTTS